MDNELDLSDENILIDKDGTITVLEMYKQEPDYADQYLHLTLPLLMYQIISVLVKQQSTVLIMLLIHAILSAISLILSIFNSKQAIQYLSYLTSNWQFQLYQFITVINLLSNIFIWYLSFQAFKRKSYRMYEYLAKVIFLSFFIQYFEIINQAITIVRLYSEYDVGIRENIDTIVCQNNSIIDQRHYLINQLQFIMNNTAVKIIKGLNIFSAVVLAFAGLWMIISLIAYQLFDVNKYFTPLFLVLFGFLLVCNEVGKGKILDEFGFLKTFLGRGLFYIFLSAIICQAYFVISASYVAADIYATIFFSLGVFYLLLNFYPKGQMGNLSRSLQIS